MNDMPYDTPKSAIKKVNLFLFDGEEVFDVLDFETNSWGLRLKDPDRRSEAVGSLKSIFNRAGINDEISTKFPGFCGLSPKQSRFLERKIGLKTVPKIIRVRHYCASQKDLDHILKHGLMTRSERIKRGLLSEDKRACVIQSLADRNDVIFFRPIMIPYDEQIIEDGREIKRPWVEIEVPGNSVFFESEVRIMGNQYMYDRSGRTLKSIINESPNGPGVYEYLDSREIISADLFVNDSMKQSTMLKAITSAVAFSAVFFSQLRSSNCIGDKPGLALALE